MVKKFLLIIAIVSLGKFGYAQDGMVPGIGSAIWIQKNNGADTRVNVKTPFIDIFKSFNLWKPHLALSVGAGITSYNILLNNQVIADTAGQISFTGKNTGEIKKYKLNVTYVELPVELCYAQDPDKHKTVFKLAAGIKLFYLVSSHTKTKYISSAPLSKSKAYDIPYLNAFAYGPELRLAYGRLGLLGSYQLNSLFDVAHSPEIHQLLVALLWDLTTRKGKLKMPPMPFRPKPNQSAYDKQNGGMSVPN